LLHCITSYPAKAEEANLKMMDVLRKKFGFPVGFSDHTLGAAIPIAAVALGAVMIEKHFTLDKKLGGPDHRASLEPNEFEQMVQGIKNVESALGSGVRKLTAEEEDIKKAARRSIVARVLIRKGSVIREDMLEYKRPGTGLEPKYVHKIIGKKANKNIEVDELITLEKLMW
jgi:sialic acid synthase SpsE